MALLAQPKKKEKYGFDPRNTNWASDDNKFGQKLMEKMGWEKGKGLGANEDGIVEHIKASYKSDTRGLGCTPRDADAWIAHQDDFNDLLRVLNEDSSKEPETVNKSDKDPQEGRKRFYGRFARGRVQTLRSTDDLDCILGRRKTSEPSTPVTQSAASTPVSQSANNSDEEEKDMSLKAVTSTFSVQEYFAKKMKELKSRKSACNGEGGVPQNLKTSAEGDSYTETKSTYGEVYFSYNDEEKSSGISTSVTEDKGWYDIDEWAVTDKKDAAGAEKKRRKKGKDSGMENTLGTQISNGKKKKLKAETVSCEEYEASVNEDYSQQDNNDKNNVGESDESIKRKKSKRKRKKTNACKSSDEDDCKEISKRKKRKLNLENNLSDECQTSACEIFSPIEDKKKDNADNTEVGTPLDDSSDNRLKKKKEKRKRKEMEMTDTCQNCGDQKEENLHKHCISKEAEEATIKKSRKQRKGEDESLGDDCCSEVVEKTLKKKKKKKDTERAHNFSDNKVKEKKKSKKESDKTSEENEAIESKTNNNIESPKSKKKKKKKVADVEITEMEDSGIKNYSNLEHNQATVKTSGSLSGDELPNKEKNTHDNTGMNIDANENISIGKLKKKRQEKKKRRQLKKDLNDSFPGSNFGELTGYVPMTN